MAEIQTGLCQCGCGQATRLSERTTPSRLLVKGEPKRFIDGHQSRGSGFHAQVIKVPRIPMSIRQRLESRIVIDAVTGCWNWRGGKDKDGYGSIKIDGQQCRAHRVSYEEYIGEIPDGLNVCHHCDNPPCINPSHFFIGTHADNQHDKVAKGREARGERSGQHTRPESNRNRNKTHCKYGHEYTPENTRIVRRANGWTIRNCRTCDHAWYIAKKERVAEVRNANRAS